MSLNLERLFTMKSLLFAFSSILLVSLAGAESEDDGQGSLARLLVSKQVRDTDFAGDLQC